jgi:adenine-specific DNA methylase
MVSYCKRLIEVDLPIKRISAHARREKSIRHGHISTLHIWWARRPLAACRAVICAALWPDPVDVTEKDVEEARRAGRHMEVNTCPPAFRTKARALMEKWAREHLHLVSQDSYPRFVAIQKDPAKLDDPRELRAALLDFIADFADWDHAAVPEFLETSRVLTQTAHEALGGLPGTKPLVVDPFAGGGAMPLEALRVGADAFASDLNPVAVLLNKVVLEYIPKYGQQLAEEVRKWGQWVKEQAEKKLGAFYPKDPDGATPIAYLWARTILSDAPGEEAIPVEVPLMRSLWLAKKAGRKQALRWVRDDQGRVQTETVEVTYADGVTRQVRRPQLEIFAPQRDSEVEAGTVARGSATCPVTGYTTRVARVREQLKARRGGASDARLFCVVTTRPGTQGRFYRLPTKQDLEAVRRAAEAMEKRQAAHTGALSLVPDEPTPDPGGHRAVSSVQLYGFDAWGDLFTPRQALALTALVRLVRDAGERLAREHDAGLAVAVQTCLAITVDRQADKASSLCRWDTSRDNVANTFGRQALPMVWDFAEANPLSGAGGDWDNALEWVAKVCEANVPTAEVLGHAQLASATSHPLPDDSAQGFVTDPPYYDAVPYADLSDFFYVWQQRTLGDLHPGLFGEATTPKKQQAVVWHPGSEDERTEFERKMRSAMAEGRRVLAPTGIGLVIFAHKSTAGWEAMLQALVDAGWVVTGSWPIDTEMGSRMNAMGTASLASSVHIVCRPRENPDGSVRTDAIGDWRDVLAELPRRIHAWLPRLAEEGVVGADAIFACLGPALEIYSRYSSVEKASGEQVLLKEYLEEVWAAVAREALSMIFEGADASGFEADARLTAMWLWTLSTGAQANGKATDEAEADGESETSGKGIGTAGFVLEYDAARKIAQGLGAHLEQLTSLVAIRGNTARLLPVSERAQHLFGKADGNAPRRGRKKQTQMSLFAALSEAQEEGGVGENTSPTPGNTVLDRIHQSMILFAAGRGEALKRFLVENGIGRDERFWRLAQALSALYPAGTDEKRWIDGVLARKKGLVF